MTSPTPELASFLKQEIEHTKQFLDGLQTHYETFAYEAFERSFFGRRHVLKNKLMSIADPDHSYLNQSARRKQHTEDCVRCYTKVIEEFQVSRERGGSSRVQVANNLEELLISLTNLKHVILDSGSR